MKVCIKENEFNTNYHLVYSEEKAIEDGYIIVDIPQGYEDCALEDIENGVFIIDKYNARKNKYLLQQELLEINAWFTEYDNQVKQYERCQRLGIEFDKDINELDNQAKTNQERIREIRNERENKEKKARVFN